MTLKDIFLNDTKCLECGTIFSGNTDNGNYLKFCNHIKSEHNLSNSDYYSKYFMGSEKQYCLCGCGNETKFFKGKFHKYYSNHKNKVKPSLVTIDKIKKKAKNRSEIDKLITKMGINVEDIEKAYYDFIDLKKPMSKLSEELFIDFRTLKSYWCKLGLIENKETFKRFTLKSKSKWLNSINKPNNDIIELLKENIFVIKTYLNGKKNVTFDDILSVLGVKIDKNYLSWFLKENLNTSEIKKIKFIKQSQIEINFLNVLKFYFGGAVLGSFELDGKIFDYKLGKKILIELDGGYWHSKEDAIKNDLLKNNIAKEYGFILIRVSDKEVKNLEFINKLKKIYDEIK
jgi:very-short-patch-repair endonuclease